jgi:hypothetical protein
VRGWCSSCGNERTIFSPQKYKLIDINSVPFAEIDALPEFLRDKMKSSEEYGNRVRHNGNIEAAGMASKLRVMGPTTEDINPDDSPF